MKSSCHIILHKYVTAVSSLLTGTACCFSELTSRRGWPLSEQRRWAGVVIFLCTSSLPPLQLHKSSDEGFQYCLNSHTSHFPALRHHSVPLFFFFFFFLPWAHEICWPFFWCCRGTVERPGRPPAPSVPLTHSCSHFLLNVVVGDQTWGSPTLWWFVSI